MKKILSLLSAGALALSMIAPAAAQGQDTTGLTPHFHFGRDHHWRGHGGPHWRSDYGGRHWRGDYHGFHHHGGYGWYNGHRGYRHWRHGYRYYNGWWFPATAFLGAAIIGNALAARPVYRGGSYHVRWCYEHYRSYRASDNTYQPYHGPRRQCVSP